MASGIVKWFNDARGYGFIAPDDGEDELFVHRTNVVDADPSTLTEGTKVEFEVGEGRKGPEATQVTPIQE